MKPAAFSRASSALIASRFFGVNHRSLWLMGLALGNTLIWCSANSLGTPGISAGFHANMSRLALRNCTNASSYLGERRALMAVVLVASEESRLISFVGTAG